MSIIKFFQKNALKTAVGEFTFAGPIGQGGNAHVLAFNKGARPYAVKFLSHERTGPLARFRDEFFGTAQIPSHPNVARAFHLDTTQIDGKEYSLIVMKRYASSLKQLGSISSENDDIKAERGWKLLLALTSGIAHLHEHGIVHRDLKPENIFYDEHADTFVVGDLGIAHFADDQYDREAKTKESERLANFSCCAPEQVIPNTRAAPTMDIFALGQVMNWYLRGSFVRGGGRQAYSGSNAELTLLDQLVSKCLQDDPKNRFQSIAELRQAESLARHPPSDPWDPIRELDLAFRASIHRISNLYETTDQKTINRFLKTFADGCDPDEFWYVRSDGGDNTLVAIAMLENGRWLLVNTYECRVEKLICYKDPSEWRSFFVLVVSADEPFELSDSDGRSIPRSNMDEWGEDAAVFYEGRYMDTRDAMNGYFQRGDEMIRIDPKIAQERHRFLRRDAFLIVPKGTGPARSHDRDPIESFLQDIVATGTTTEEKVRDLIEATVDATDDDITNRL